MSLRWSQPVGALSLIIVIFTTRILQTLSFLCSRNFHHLMAFELQGATETFDRLNAFFSKGTTQQNPGLIEQFQILNLPHAKVNASEWYFDDIRMGYSEWQYEKPDELEWKYQF